eukprot:5826621-Prymnesium_polylepis.1
MRAQVDHLAGSTAPANELDLPSPTSMNGPSRLKMHGPAAMVHATRDVPQPRWLRSARKVTFCRTIVLRHLAAL